VASRIYLLLIARRYCDLVVDVTGLGNPERRAATEDALSRLLHVEIDLGNFEQRVDYPKQLIKSPADCRTMINELLGRGLAEANASDDERVFARRLVEATWEAHDRFMAYTSGARELIEQASTHVAELGKAVDSLTGRARELERRIAHYEHELAALRRAGEARRMQTEAAEANLHNALREIADLQARLAEPSTGLSDAGAGSHCIRD
jgi:chromosome segregation ATPase